MNVGAHPLVVAVALGMLSPAALAGAEDPSCNGAAPRTLTPCSGCDCGRADLDEGGSEDREEGARSRVAGALGEMLR